MSTFSEMIVGLWLVPVLLCILIPLAIFCVSIFTQLLKKVESKTPINENTIKEAQI